MISSRVLKPERTEKLTIKNWHKVVLHFRYDPDRCLQVKPELCEGHDTASFQMHDLVGQTTERSTLATVQVLSGDHATIIGLVLVEGQLQLASK